MATALDLPESALDERERKFVANIREYEWCYTSVMAEDERPEFSYSTGLWLSVQVPELIIFSTKTGIVRDLFWSMFRDIKAGSKFPVAQPTNDVFANLPAYLFPVAEKYYREYLGWSRWFYAGNDFPCLQLVWPDREGLFPWESGFDEAFRDDQPDLTENGWRASLGLSQ